MACCTCLGHTPQMRFDEDCHFDVPRPDASIAKMLGACSFYWAYLRSGADFSKMYRCIFLPVYYLFGLFWLVLKVFLLNPPCFLPLQSELHFEMDASFPGSTPAERLVFAKRWYSTERRPSPFTMSNVQSRFTFLADKLVWLERLAVFSWLVLPAQTAPCVWDEQSQKWMIWFPWWSPDVRTGWAITGENPEGTGWLITGKLKIWCFLRPFYEWITIQTVEGYCDSVVAAAAEAGMELGDAWGRILGWDEGGDLVLHIPGRGSETVLFEDMPSVNIS